MLSRPPVDESEGDGLIVLFLHDLLHDLFHLASIAPWT